MKTISIKEFRKSRQRMTRAQYEKECGIEVDSPEVYSYINFFYIEIHRGKENGKKDLYNVRLWCGEVEYKSLKDAEKYLYENIKSELPTKSKKEKIDKNKFPLGLESWLDTHYQIVEYMGYNQSKFDKGECIYKGSEVIEDTLEGQAGKQEFAEKLTTKFEHLIKNEEFDFDITNYEYELDKFLKDAFYPKNKKRFHLECIAEISCIGFTDAYSLEEALDNAKRGEISFNDDGNYSEVNLDSIRLNSIKLDYEEEN
jgi:hypothetical protein